MAKQFVIIRELSTQPNNNWGSKTEDFDLDEISSTLGDAEISKTSIKFFPPDKVFLILTCVDKTDKSKPSKSVDKTDRRKPSISKV